VGLKLPPGLVRGVHEFLLARAWGGEWRKGERYGLGLLFERDDTAE
jgi:hypothetical protein